jgi:hypothetical protein
MTTTIHGRAAIRERISEWHRQHHYSDHSQTHSLFWNATPTERVRWFRQF